MQAQGRGERDDLVVAAVQDQGRQSECGNLVLVHDQCVDTVLSWLREHARERLLRARTDRRGQPDVGEFVGDPAAVVGEQVEQPADVRERGREPPDLVEPGGERERDTDAAHQHELLDPPRLLGREAQGHGTAEAVAHDREPVQPERVAEPRQVPVPRRHPELHTRRRPGAAEPQQVGSHHPEPLRQIGDDAAPVRPRGHAGPRPVQQQDDRALPHVVVIGGDPLDVHGPADLRIARHGVTGSAARPGVGHGHASS